VQMYNELSILNFNYQPITFIFDTKGKLSHSFCQIVFLRSFFYIKKTTNKICSQICGFLLNLAEY